jgi:hypothetical protein
LFFILNGKKQQVNGGEFLFGFDSSFLSLVGVFVV